ncbi:hypothetical protein ACP70R_037367 [Stipagrostis hirtigluma subsp. patula]
METDGGGRSAGGAAAKKKKNGKKSDDRTAARSGGGGCAPLRGMVPFDQVLAASDALRGRLAALRATAPSYVMGKPLTASDVDRNQARLLFSCKLESLARCPLTRCFTDLEMPRVVDPNGGLLVTALDRRGRSYDLTCKYLASNYGYRLISGWNAFREGNGLVADSQGRFRRDVHVELWAFRSPELPNRRLQNKKKVREDTGHPDGSLGLVLLHYDRGELPVDHREEERSSVLPPAVQGPATRQTEEASTSAPVAPEPKLAGAERARMMAKEDMIAMFGEQMTNAAIGMCSLRKASLELDRVEEDMDADFVQTQ